MSATPPWFWTSPADGPPAEPLLGGKGAGLARLEALGLPVPPFFVVTTEAFRSALEAAGLAARIESRLAGGDATPEAAEEIQAWVRDVPLPPALAEGLSKALRAGIPEGAALAVRSSARGEDAAGSSFAGIHESVLGVRGEAALRGALARVWASAFGARALAYRRGRGLPLSGIGMGVVVQAALPARASGVVFTRDPADGSDATIVACAVWGLGEGLVGGALDADTFRFRREGLEAIEARIAAKEERFVLDPGPGGTRREPVPQDSRARACLSAAEARGAVEAALRIEAAEGRPQDVEFAVDPEGRVLLLQARPVTAAGPAAAPAGRGNRRVCDNSNIIESYAGVTTPMTFSFIRRAYAIVYRVFAETMGVPPAEVRRNVPVFENMLGLFRGRVYYNLENWYRLIRLFPGYAFNRRFMEGMMGVREPMADGALAPPSFLRRWLVELPSLVRLAARSGWNFLRLRRLVASFRARFEACVSRWSALDFDRMEAHELLALHREMEDSILRRWKAPIVNDFFVMIAYGTLKRLCVRWCGDEAGTLQNDLLCGEGGIESAEPARMLLEIAAAARGDAALRERILRGDPADLARAVPADPACAALAAGVSRYLDRFGFRCADELKLESPTVRDDPSFLYRILQNHLSMDDASFARALGGGAREAGIRAAAEARAFGAVRGLRFGRLRLAPFRRVLGWARLGVKNRENLRLARARVYALLRDLIRAMGRKLAAAGALETPGDVFYLALDEVWDFVKGTAITVDLKGLAALRRREFDGYRRDPSPPDPRFSTEGMAYAGNRFGSGAPASGGGILKGLGCCPGVVEAEARVIRDPAAEGRLRGEILVAERTDPGWVPLFPSVSGILVERGSILSHSAIVAREMGIPTIVGIPGLLATLRTGDRVRMDGSAGTVERLEPGTPASTGVPPTPPDARD